MIQLSSIFVQILQFHWIFVRIALKEYKKGGSKIDLNTLESQLVKAVKRLDIPSENPEKVYHAFVLGLLVHLKTHRVKSNRESGYGRYDIMLIPRDISQAAAVIEFKRTRKRRNKISII